MFSNHLHFVLYNCVYCWVLFQRGYYQDWFHLTHFKTISPANTEMFNSPHSEGHNPTGHHSIKEITSSHDSDGWPAAYLNMAWTPSISHSSNLGPSVTLLREMTPRSYWIILLRLQLLSIYSKMGETLEILCDLLAGNIYKQFYEWKTILQVSKTYSTHKYMDHEHGDHQSSWKLITIWVPWASYHILKIARCACAGNTGNVFPRRRLQRKPLVSDLGMHHGTCVTHVPWCMSGSLTRGGGENVPGIPGACAPAILRIWQKAHATIPTHAVLTRSDSISIYR